MAPQSRSPGMWLNLLIQSSGLNLWFGASKTAGSTAASAMPGCLKSALVETPSQAEAVLGQSQSAMRRVDINTEHLSSALSSIPDESVYASLRMASTSGISSSRNEQQVCFWQR